MPAKSAEQRAKEQEYNREVGRRIREVIAQAKTTPSIVADDLKISRSLMSLYMSGRRRASAAALQAISQQLGIAASTLLPSDTAVPEEATGRPSLAAVPQLRAVEGTTDEDLPSGLAHYLKGREDHIAPVVVRQLKTTRFQLPSGVALDDTFWDFQRRAWERRLGLPPMAD